MHRLPRALLALAFSTLLLNAVFSDEDHKQAPATATPADIEQLIKQLGSDDVDKREAASQALEAVGEPVMSALRKTATTDGDAEIRKRADKVVNALLQQYRQLRCYKGHSEDANGVAFAPDGKRFLSAGNDQTCTFRDFLNFPITDRY